MEQGQNSRFTRSLTPVVISTEGRDLLNHCDHQEIYSGHPAVMKYVLYFTLWAALRAFNFAPGKISHPLGQRYELLPVICLAGRPSVVQFAGRQI